MEKYEVWIVSAICDLGCVSGIGNTPESKVRPSRSGDLPHSGPKLLEEILKLFPRYPIFRPVNLQI